MNNTTFTSNTIKEATDKYGNFKVALKISGYEGDSNKMYQVIYTSFGDSEVFTFKTRRHAEKKYGYHLGGIEA